MTIRQLILGDSWSVPVAGAVLLMVVLGLLPLGKDGTPILGSAPLDLASFDASAGSSVTTADESHEVCSNTMSDSDGDFRLRFGARNVRPRLGDVEVVDSIAPWGPDSNAWVRIPSPVRGSNLPPRRQWRLKDSDLDG